ncbi:MAG: hypothetical protein P8N72_17640 [Flavimaricola sp.]|nr:hypothetical protein [Flavimaricola sp.]
MDIASEAICLDTLEDEVLRVLPTPACIYDFDAITRRIDRLTHTFLGMFAACHPAVPNANSKVLGHIAGLVPFIDATSALDVQRALSIGITPDRITWSGPGKRDSELRALAGRGVIIVVGTEDEIDCLAEIAKDLILPQPVLLSIGPDHAPDGFGPHLEGRPSLFGVDEAAIPRALACIKKARWLRLVGFHSSAEATSLSPPAIAENLANLARIFDDASRLADIVPDKLVFGSGFGTSFNAGEAAVDIGVVRDLMAEVLLGIKKNPRLSKASRLLETGDWITAPTTALVTRVLSIRESRGVSIAVCDADFGNHRATPEVLGSTVQAGVRPEAQADSGTTEETCEYLLQGPQSTTSAVPRPKVQLPLLWRGDILAVPMLGGSVRQPGLAEYALHAGQLRDVSESQ